MKIFAAPIQGYTDAPYRHFHAHIYSPADTYCSPFMHIERGGPRKRDLRDITSQLNSNQTLLPQILVKDSEEFGILTEAVVNSGFKSVDLNLGCPFPPQVKKGRGAGLIKNTAELNKIACKMRSVDGIAYSIKMRLGIDSANEWRDILPIINDMPLSHVTIHPRIAVQQYSGDLFLDEFEKALHLINHPIVFNGDIHSPEDIKSVASHYPKLLGIMIGRGLLSRPSLIGEYREGCDLERDRQIELLLELHSQLLSHYESCLCGDAQILSKIKPFWEYPTEMIGHKCAKLIKKAGSLTTYKNAVSSIGNF